MRIARFLLMSIVAASFAMFACSGQSDYPTIPSPPPASVSCDASKAQFAIGQVASDDLLERARTAAGAGSARYLRPDQPITTEYLGSRLNLNLNARDIVDGVSCG